METTARCCDSTRAGLVPSLCCKQRRRLWERMASPPARQTRALEGINLPVQRKGPCRYQKSLFIANNIKVQNFLLCIVTLKFDYQAGKPGQVHASSALRHILSKTVHRLHKTYKIAGPAWSSDTRVCSFLPIAWVLRSGPEARSGL